MSNVRVKGHSLPTGYICVLGRNPLSFIQWPYNDTCALKLEYDAADAGICMTSSGQAMVDSFNFLLNLCGFISASHLSLI